MAARRKVTKGENPCRIMEEEEGVHQARATLLDRRAAACKQSDSPGPLLLRRMIDLSMAVREPYHHIRLNVSFRSDLEWWATFLPLWNGVAILGDIMQLPINLTVTSDASGRWGCGAFSEKEAWFQLPWSGAWEAVHITVKELLPVVVACAVWGRAAKGGRIQCRTDNAAVVSIVNSGRSKDELAMHLVRCLAFFAAYFEYRIRAIHISGRENGAADAL